MLKKKCSDCGKKIEKGFNYCPYCGSSIKKQKDEEYFGMIGKDDFVGLNNEVKMPFGLNKIVNSLINQLEKQMGELDKQHMGTPRGFKIQISTGKPQVRKIQPKIIEQSQIMVSNEEIERRNELPKVEASSNVKRLPEGLIYEISAPGVKSKQDVVITKLEESLEVKAYSKDRCYVKTIPLKVEVMGYGVKDDKVFLQLKD